MGYNSECPLSLLTVSRGTAGNLFSRKEEYVGPFTLKAGNRVRIGDDAILQVDAIRPLNLSIREGPAEITMHTNRKRGLLRGTLKYKQHPISLRIKTDGDRALISFLNVPHNVRIRTLPKAILHPPQPRSA